MGVMTRRYCDNTRGNCLYQSEGTNKKIRGVTTHSHTRRHRNRHIPQENKITLSIHTVTPVEVSRDISHKHEIPRDALPVTERRAGDNVAQSVSLQTLQTGTTRNMDKTLNKDLS